MVARSTMETQVGPTEMQAVRECSESRDNNGPAIKPREALPETVKVTRPTRAPFPNQG